MYSFLTSKYKKKSLICVCQSNINRIVLRNSFALPFVWLLSVFSGFSQSVGTTVSKNEIKIGEQIQLTLKTKVNNSDRVVFPDLDSIGKMEVVQSFLPEKQKTANQTEWIKKYNITQFEAGKFIIPSLEVVVNKKKINSESIEIVVTDVDVDTTKQKMHNIKEDININLEKTEQNPELSDKEIGIGLLLAIFVASFLYVVLKIKHRNKTKVSSYISPYNKAFLRFSEINSQIKDKEYYSVLTEIIKQYFEKTLEFLALESTTEQFIIKLKKAVAEKQFQISEATILQIEKLFTKADLVKFAKITVSESEKNNDKFFAENCIAEFHKTLPASTEEKQFEMKKIAASQLLKKQKNIRQTVCILAFLFSIFSVVFFLGWENVTNYFNAKMYGKDAGYYLKKEWIVSEYGLPILQMETPEVLVRDSVPNSKIYKNYSQFSWQKPTNQLSISLKTIAYHDSISLNVKEIFNDEIGNLMQLKAQNIKTTARKFKNEKGISGDILEGTFEIVFENEKKQMRFLTVFISDCYGLQQVRITHEAKDKFAKSFVDRVTNSMEQINQEDEEIAE